MFENDYVANLSKKFENHDMAQQAAFGLAAGILTDIAYGRAAKKILGQAKSFEVCSTAWIEIGEYTTKLMSQLLGLPKVQDFKDLKDVIQAAYRAWLLPLNILEDNEDVFKYQCLSCPFPFYGFARFDVQENDHTCRTWQAMTPTWLTGIIKGAGFTGVFQPKIDSAICRGDSCCLVTVERVKTDEGKKPNSFELTTEVFE